MILINSKTIIILYLTGILHLLPAMVLSGEFIIKLIKMRIIKLKK